jgi:FAD/FMN-containing dehydrogenase
MSVSLDDLRAAAPGSVLVSGDAGFDAECCGFNLAVVQHPDVVVAATSVDDVVAAVKYAAQEGLTVRVQATGHGAASPVEGGLLVTTSRMTAATIDPEQRTATVSAGTRWGDVIEAAAPHGLAPLNGSSAGVGVVGYTLGGGTGPMGRTFGFAADYVRRIQLVVADGTVLEVDADHEPELFWALRGGKCNIGIVTELEFGLMPVAQYYGGGIFYPGEAAATVLHKFRSWVLTLPEQATTSVALLRLPDLPEVPEPLRGRLSVHLRFVYIGDEADGAALIAPMREVARPLVDMVATTPYAAISSVHQDPVDPLPVWDGSALLREFPAAAVDALLATAGPDVDIPLILAEVRYLGGAQARQPEVPNAVGGRDAAFSVYVVGPYPPELHGIVDAAGEAVLAATAPWSTGSTQINFQAYATAPGDIRRAWPAEVRERLLAVKEEWDPQGRFRFSYPLEAGTATGEVSA